MPRNETARYCADPMAIAALKRDGLGWGHDLECGCFTDSSSSPRPGLRARLAALMGRRT